jgi:hypothetical protein
VRRRAEACSADEAEEGEWEGYGFVDGGGGWKICLLGWAWSWRCCLVMIHERLCGRGRGRGIFLRLSVCLFINRGLGVRVREVGGWVGALARCIVRGFFLSRYI